jgi:hypothetical protein
MKNARFLLIIIGVAILLVATATLFTNCTHEEVSVVGMDNTKPPIDTVRPSVTKTATFALG